MGRRAFVLSLILVIAGCASTSGDMRVIWTGHSSPPDELSPPRGFAVTPAQAYVAVRESRRLSLKHDWRLYADSRYYYVDDAFTKTSARTAKRRGLRINGQTGEIEDR